MIWEYFFHVLEISTNKREDNQFLEGGANSADTLNYFVPPSSPLPPPPAPSVLKGRIFFDIHWILMHFGWFGSTFPRHLKFLQIKEGVPNFWGEPIVQMVWIVWSALLYFNFESLKNQNSSWFIRYQCTLPETEVPFSCFSNFLKFKRGPKFFGGNQFCR